MMILLVFLVILFGMFGVISTQFMGQYREGYSIWINDIVYNKKNDKNELCSRIESLTREICWINDLTMGIIFMIIISIVTIVITYIETWSLITDPKEKFISYSCLFLTTMIFFAVPIILQFILKVNVISPSKTSGIDRKLFEVWKKHKCFNIKEKDYILKFEPYRLYELLFEYYKTNYEKGIQVDISPELINGLKEKYERKSIFSLP